VNIFEKKTEIGHFSHMQETLGLIPSTEPKRKKKLIKDSLFFSLIKSIPLKDLII
jgi:hypothetical protein